MNTKSRLCDQALGKLSEKLNSTLLVQEEDGLQKGAQNAPLAKGAQKRLAWMAPFRLTGNTSAGAHRSCTHLSDPEAEQTTGSDRVGEINQHHCRS